MGTLITSRNDMGSNPPIPPIIGFFVADKSGRTLFTIEAFEGALRSHLIAPSQEVGCDLDGIMMFISALESIMNTIDFERLEECNVNGHKFKMHVLFDFKEFSLAFFSHPGINFAHLRQGIRLYFREFFKKNHSLHQLHTRASLPAYTTHLKLSLENWLRDLNYRLENLKR